MDATLRRALGAQEQKGEDFLLLCTRMEQTDRPNGVTYGVPEEAGVRRRNGNGCGALLACPERTDPLG
jgi:hypothetical protein